MRRKLRQETLDGKEEEPNEGGLAEREGRKDPTRTAECVNMVNEPIGSPPMLELDRTVRSW